MSDLLRAIDNIRSYLDAGASVASDRLRENAKLYAEACQKVNERLSECARLLGQGLRTEGLHLAQLDPPLLDQLSTLDFPGSDRWASISTSCGVPTPLLQLRLAQQLNAAYAEDRPLVELLKQHRRLALSKGDLLERIRTLRKIADIDKANIYWDDDLRVLEKARLSELKDTFERAKKEQDFDQIHAIHDEVLSLEWREVPDVALVRAVEKALEKVRDHELREQFEQWEAALSQCLQDRNLAQARTARTQIQTLIGTNRISMQDPILRSIPEMLNWLSQEDARLEKERQFEAAIRKLQQDLSVPEPNLTTVKTSWRAVSSFGFPIPRRVEDDYLACEYRFAERQRRKRIMTVGILLVALLLTGLGIYFFISEARKRTKLNDAVARFVNETNFEVARDLYDDGKNSFDTRFTNDEGVQKALPALLKHEEAKAKRQAEAQKLIELAKTIDLKDENCRYTLKSALELERQYLSPVDKSQLEKRMQDYEDLRKTERSKADQTFTEDLTKLEAKRGDFRQFLKDPEKQATCEKLLLEIGDGCRKLAALEKSLNDESLRARFTSLKMDLDSDKKEQEAVVKERKLTTEFDRIFENRAFKPGELELRLKEEARKDPTSQRAKDFTAVAKERDGWEAQLNWNDFLSKVGDLSTEAGATTMGDRITAMATFMNSTRTFLNTNQRILHRKEILDYEAYLKAYSLRVKASGDFQKYLNRRDCQNLFALRFKNNVTYFLRSDPTAEILRLKGIGRERIQVSPILSKADLEDGAKLSEPFLRLSDLVEDKAIVAPQVHLVDSILEKLKKIQTDSWDKTVVEVLTTIAEAREVEPILRADLAYRLLVQIEIGNPILAKQLAEARTALQKVDREFKWLDPNEKDSGNQREKATTALKLIPEPSKLLDQLAKSRDAITSVLKESSHLAQGWIQRETPESFRLRTPNKALEDGFLFVMASDGTTPLHWVRVTSVTAGRINPILPAEAKVEGRPLFASKKLIDIK